MPSLLLLIDFVLTGDNAVGIGTAVRDRPPGQRRQAVMLGGLLALPLRLALTIPAEWALKAPFPGTVGGLLLACVAYRLLTGEDVRAELCWSAFRGCPGWAPPC